jgi:hypothetical protein
MELPESIALGSFVLGTLGFMYKMTKDVSDIRKQVTNDLQHMSEGETSKRARVYERLDEFKKHAEDKFTHKDVCHVLHTQIDDKLNEIATDVKILIKNGDDRR